MSKFTFYKKWDAYDVEIMKAGLNEIHIRHFVRLCDLPAPTDEMLKEFEQCKKDIEKRNIYLRNIGRPLVDEEFCKTDLQTSCLENMMQLLRKLYSGYTHYEESDVAITSSNSKLVAVYDVFDKNENFVGLIEETTVPEVRRA